MRKATPRALLLTLFAAGLAAAASAQTPLPEIWSTNFERSYAFPPGRTVVIDNRMGNVIVEGVGGNTLELRAKVTIRGADTDAVRAARAAITLQSNPIPGGRMIRTAGNEPGERNWAAIVDYHLRVPRNCNIAITTASSNYIQTIDITGSLQIKNFSGRIDVAATGAPMMIDTTNGDIIIRLKGEPREDSRLTTLNGSVQLYSQPDLAFDWIAESLSGQVRWNRELVSSTPARDRNNRLVAAINGGGKRIYTASMTGSLLLGRLADAPSEVRPNLERSRARQENQVADSDEIIEIVSRFLLQRPGAKNFAFKQNRVPDTLQFNTRVGNVVAVELNDATIETGAGEIVVGRAKGSLRATTHGGPINVGETMGSAELRTDAGDIMINSASQGAHAQTGGGNIRVRRSGGDLRLISGGGDITVHEAGGDVVALTKSGDISITVPDSVSTLSLDLRTVGGNVIVTLPARLKATVEATVVSSQTGTHTIDSNVAGLAIVQDVIDGKNRVRARGTLNGGGPLLRIVAEDGNIRLRQSGTR